MMLEGAKWMVVVGGARSSQSVTAAPCSALQPQLSSAVHVLES
jgi:hypothetical protein